jgi:DNA-binding LacI/PurR family transcriptional regulator
MTSRAQNDAGTPPRRPTLKDVAKAAGVDPSLVSKVLNEDPRVSLTEATRARILSAVQELGYRPNLRARGLRLSRTWTLAAVFPDLRNPVYVPIVEGARRRAAARGYGLILGTADGPSSADQRWVERLLHDRVVDGLLLASGQASDELLSDIASEAAPVVVVNRKVSGVDSCVLVDDAAACRIAAEHLASLGHERVGVISGPKTSRGDSDSSTRRVHAFVERMRELGGEVTENYADDWDARAGLNAATTLLTKAPEVTAIYGTTVMLALGILKAAHKLDLGVPERLSVISLHDTEAAAFTEPALTTVALPMEDLGALGVDRLIDKIEGKSVGFEVMDVAPQLILRESTSRITGH